MTYIPYSEGKVYDKVHLRPFDLGLAKAGHPLADTEGREVRLFRSLSESSYSCDAFSPSHFPQQWLMPLLFDNQLSGYLRLAPLAVKDGLPLHVGDVIEVPAVNLLHEVTIEDLDNGWHKSSKWRFPKDENE